MAAKHWQQKSCLTVQMLVLIGIVSVLLVGCSALQGNKLGETRIKGKFQRNSVERIKAGTSLVEQLNKAGVGAENVQKIVAALTRPLPKTLTLTDGKDKEHIEWQLNIAKGTAEYEANKVVATDAAEVKAKIAKEVGDDAVKAIEKALPGGFKGLIDALSEAGVI